MNRTIAGTVALSALLIVGAVAAADTASTQGEVLEIQRGVSAPDRGEFDQLTIRTRNGETRRLLLGPSGSCPDCVRVGDRIRARVMAGDGSETPQRVQSMRVRRTGETIPFRNEAGELTRERARRGDGSGTGSANRYGGSSDQGRHQGGSRHGSRGGSCGAGRR